MTTKTPKGWTVIRNSQEILIRVDASKLEASIDYLRIDPREHGYVKPDK